METKKKNSSLLQLMEKYPDEVSARKYFECLRWENGIICPHCESRKRVYIYDDGRLYKCSECLKQFTVKIGTIFEGSALPLRKWLLAIYIEGSHKKGISSIQLAKDLGVTQKSAWFMLHRIRFALDNGSILKGVVEADESYFGGKDSNKHKIKKLKGSKKSVVVGAVERGGNVKALKVRFVGEDAVKFVVDNVERGSVLMTDEARHYTKICEKGFRHGSINHSGGKYVNGVIHTNTIEGFWSHLKRGINGIQHHVSDKHLQKYINVYSYRWNTREMTDFDRFEMTMKNLTGRLTYKELIGKE